MADEPISDFKPKSLDDLLVETPEPDKAEAKAETPPEKPESEKPEDQKGEPETDKGKEPESEKGKGDEKPKEDAPPASEETKKSAGLQAALLDERRKRQGLETELDTLKREVGELKKSPRPDPLEDPEGAAEYDRKEAQLKEAEADEKMWQMRADLTEELMRENHADYEEVKAVFVAEAQTNQALAIEFTKAKNPAKFAYTEGKRLQQVQAMGDDPAAYIQTQVEEGVKKALEALGKDAPAKVPESLAEAPSATNKEVKEWGGPAPITEILKG